MNAYADQNFLINCANSAELRARASETASQGKVAFVLSPWHFYEIGKTGPERIQELLSVVADLKPSWILDRFDLQLGEFKEAWGRFWGTPFEALVPVGNLPYVAACLLRTTPARLEGAGLERYVEVFRRLGTDNIDPMLESQREVSAANQVSYREGKLTRSVKEQVLRSYVAQQLASLETKFSSHEEHARQLAIVRQNRLLMEQVEFFVQWGGMRDLRAWTVESLLTDHHQAGTAALNANRQIDRQHAVAGLAYCDRLITDDKELLKRSDEVARLAPFAVAKAQSAADLFASL